LGLLLRATSRLFGLPSLLNRNSHGPFALDLVPSSVHVIPQPRACS
jgi:hypothetical protein